MAKKITLEYISDWLERNRPEFELYEGNIYINAKEKLVFFHNIPECREKFEMRWNDLLGGQGCSICRGYQIGERNSLAYLRPDLASEWHPNNTLNPYEVSISSGKRVYWICSECGYGENGEWFVSPHRRTTCRAGCKRCSDKRHDSLLANILKDFYVNNYNAEKEYRICLNPKTGRYLPYDIYIPVYNTFIEIHGEQHYFLCTWHKRQAEKNDTTPEEEFEYQKYKDKIKKKFAKKNGTYIEVDLRKIKILEDAIEFINNLL